MFLFPYNPTQGPRAEEGGEIAELQNVKKINFINKIFIIAF